MVGWHQVTVLRAEARVYLNHLAALFVPGRPVQSHSVLPPALARVGQLKDWTDDELNLLIEECRRTLDQQHSRFDRLRTTAQVILPVSIALVVVIGSGLRNIVGEPTDCVRYGLYAAWFVGAALGSLAALGAAATLSVRSDFGSIMPTVLSQLDPPIKIQLARSYAEQIAVGETTVGTRVTVIRDAVSLLALAGTVQGAIWLIDVL